MNNSPLSINYNLTALVNGVMVAAVKVLIVIRDLTGSCLVRSVVMQVTFLRQLFDM